jgi:catecholate siderophore receptor
MTIARQSAYRYPLVLAATVALACAGNALAQTEDDVEEIVVKGRYLSIDKVNSVKTPTPVIDIPQSLSIVTSEQIQDQAFQNIGDVLRYTPGLSISQGEGHRDAIIIRGIQTTADFFIDGLRDDVQYYRPLYNVSQVEVLRGSNALLFGRGGGGGVINRVQKKPVIGETFTTFSAGADTFGAHSTNLDVNLEAGSNHAFRLNAYYQGLANHRDFFDGDGYAVNPTYRFETGEGTSFDLSYEHVYDERVVDRGVPSRVVDTGPDVPLEGYRDTFFGSPDENYTTFRADILRARVSHDFSDTLRANVTLQYADYDKAYQNLYPSDAVVVTDGSFDEVELDGYRDPTERQNLIGQANLVWDFETGGLAHTLLFGMEFGDQQTANSRQDNVFAANGDDQLVIPFTDPLSIPEFGFTNPVRDRESDVRFSSVYLQDQVDLTDSFKLVAGLRLDEFDIDVLDRIEQNDGDADAGNFTRNDSEVTPRLGFIYKPAENLSIYASYSETFLPQSGDQFLTLNLDTQSTRPQFFENREVGVKWDLRPDLSLTAAVFELERESFTTVDPEDQEQLLIVDGSTTQGFELQFVGNVTRDWSISAGYSYLDGEVSRADGGGNDGNRTRQTPENMFSLWSNYALSDRLGLGLGVTYQDSFFVTEDNAVEVPSYTRVDAAVFYSVSDRLRMQLNVENLLDEDYFPDAHSNTNITTGRPVNARLSAILSF